MASVIVVGRNKTREVLLEDAVTVIGRDGGASIELGDLQVSRRHALLVHSAEGYFVKDLGSRNGVLVNHRRVPPRQHAKLRNGDVLSLGRTTLVFKDLATGASDEVEAKVATLVRIPMPPARPAPDGSSAAGAGPAGADAGAATPPAPAMAELTVDDMVEGAAPAADEDLRAAETEVGDVALAETQDALQDSNDPDASPADGAAPPAAPVPEATPAAARAAGVGRAPGAAPAGAGASARPGPAGAGAPPTPSTPAAPALAAARAAAPAPAAPASAAPASAGAGRPRAPVGRRAPSGRVPRGDDAIPRALPGGLGGADLLLRAFERADRERVFYRNLVLVLAGVVVATFVGLLAWAVATREPASPAPGAAGAPASAPSAPAPTQGEPVAAAGDLDAAVFARDVQPVLSARCAICHSAVGRGGGLVLAQSDDARTVEANLWAVRRFVRPGRPQESALLLKPLPAHEGGPGHGGGEVLSMSSPEWRAMAAWVEGTSPAAPGSAEATPAAPARVENRPPVPRIEAGPGPVRVGEPLPLLGAADDLDGDPLSFRWALKARPAGSSAAIERPGEPTASLLPDRAGTYVVTLVVHDGRSAATTELTVVAEERAAAAGTTPAARTTTHGLAGPRAFEALTGAAPTADVAAELAELSGDALVDALLQRPEVYRAWWEAELEHFALTGEHRPKGATWDSVPDRLRAGRLTPVDALQAVLFSQGFTARHAGRDAYVTAVLERVLGLSADEAAPARPAAERLYDGHAAELFGKKGASQADLVRIAAQDPRARRALLARAHRRVTGVEATAEVLDAALAEVLEAPGRTLPIVVRWACGAR